MLKRLAAACLFLISEVVIMQRNFERSMPLVLKHEGGFVNHPRDPGGATMKGVTLATFRQYKPGATVADLKAISDDMLARIYRDGYWNKVRGDDLPAGVDYAVFDFAVNSGPGRAAKYLQSLLLVPVDGVIGPRTVAAAKKADAAQLINALCDKRMAFLRALDTWPTFGKGWSSRVAGVRKEALKMAQEGGKPVPAPQQPAKPQSPSTGETAGIPGMPDALPIEPGTVHKLPPDNSRLPARNVWLGWLIDLLMAFAGLFSRKEK